MGLPSGFIGEKKENTIKRPSFEDMTLDEKIEDFEICIANGGDDDESSMTFQLNRLYEERKNNE